MSRKTNFTLIPLGDVQDDVTEESIMELHPGQHKVVNSPAQKQLVLVGCRWGKTTAAIELAIKRCKDTPSKVVRIYAHDYSWACQMRKMIIDRLRKEDIFMKTFGDMIVLTNTSRIIVDVLNWPDEDVIFDDALSRHNVVILETASGWEVTTGSSCNNPYITVPEELMKV